MRSEASDDQLGSLDGMISVFGGVFHATSRFEI